LGDLEMLLNRAYYPLTGYLTRPDYESALEAMRLRDGAFWPAPVCLDVDEDIASRTHVGQSVALRDPEGFLLAVLSVEDVWKPSKSREAEALFGKEFRDLPEARRFIETIGDWRVGGAVEGISLPVRHDFRELRLTPADTRRLFATGGWRQVAGYRAQGLIHRGDKEMILRGAREAGARIFLQAAEHVKDALGCDRFTRVRCLQAAAKRFPKNLAILGVSPLFGWGAGPRETLLWATVMKNYGCSHFMMVPEDRGDSSADNRHGKGLLPELTPETVARIAQEEIGIKVIHLEPMAYVEEKAEHIPMSRIGAHMTARSLSPDELKRRLEHELDVPEWFSYPEIIEELRFAFPPKSRQGFTIFLTGLSGSGKSTLAKVLVTKFMEMRDRPVTLLDGDVVRKNLSSELTFSREHRNLNITRIGFVASEITKNGGIAVCAPIAPFEESRRRNRELIGRYGGYIEVYLCTPLSVCEQRDRKGMYAKARAGLISGFTGVDDPYETPESPELTIDTTELTPEEAAQEIMLYLAEQGFIK
jgi:sulfate adenylyltransferase